MRAKFFLYILAAAISIFADVEVSAQSNKTIVFVRHTEKDGSMSAGGDPDLSLEGRERAQRLMKFAKKYKPHEIFSTDYKRTRQTVEPIAAYRKKPIQIYDPAKPTELIGKMLASTTDHYLIVGHSNTIPALANLLVKKEVFRSLIEEEYGLIWVVRMKNGIVTKVEIFTY